MTEIFRNSQVNNSALKAYIRSIDTPAASKERPRVRDGKVEEGHLDEVSFSREGKEIATLLERAKYLPEVREELVAALKAKIEAGEYHVDARKIAEKILSREGRP